MTVRQQIPVGGGEQPHWREDSGEVYYISPRGKIVAVKIRLGTKIEMGPATELFQTHTEGPQSAHKMRHRRCYHDLGLMFAKEWSEGRRRHDVLGTPIAVNNIGEREFAALVNLAGVRLVRRGD